jgi:branched-chain amino acid transport system ATP-binding protein
MTRDAAAGPHDAIQLWGVRKSFGRTDIIRGVDLAVRSGECHVLIGPNGAGKSTIFHLISGALRATGGRIALNGHDITRSSPSAISRQGLGRSFQTSNLFGRLTAFENARIGAFRYAGYGPCFWRLMRRGSPADMRALEVLDEVGLLDQRATPASLLSYADQRALEIALALAGGQRILLFDEPTAGMNREETAKIIALLRQLRASDPRRTFVLIEHDMDVVFGLADRISVLVYGEIIATGTPADIRADARVQEAYLGAAASHESSH